MTVPSPTNTIADPLDRIELSLSRKVESYQRILAGARKTAYYAETVERVEHELALATEELEALRALRAEVQK